MDRLVTQRRKRQSVSIRPGGSGRKPRPSYATALVLIAVFGCASCGNSRPVILLADGSRGGPIPSPLRDLGDTAVLTSERTVTEHNLDSRGRACMALDSGRRLAPGQAVVERVDHFGSSLTYRPRGGPFVFGCASSAARKHAWCGHAVGEIRRGHLADPRLDIACRTATGAPLGSAWIEPVADAKWIVVRGRDLIQIYPVATGVALASLPVRVTTLAADIPTATALFRIEQYDAKGTRIAEATLRAAVAG